MSCQLRIKHLKCLWGLDMGTFMTQSLLNQRVCCLLCLLPVNSCLLHTCMLMKSAWVSCRVCLRYLDISAFHCWAPTCHARRVQVSSPSVRYETCSAYGKHSRHLKCHYTLVCENSNCILDVCS